MSRLYNYFRSSASYRVRITLELKQLSYEYIPIHLLRDGGEQFKPEYRCLNPDALTPTYVGEDSTRITQSLAIIEYLEETCPRSPVLPSAPADRAYVRSLALQIACEIHPLNNLRVLGYLTNTLKVSDAERASWYAHWVEQGFASLETKLVADGKANQLCFGDVPTLADICLVPQVFNAERMKVSMEPYPTVMRVATNARALDAFVRAEPSRQPDAF